MKKVFNFLASMRFALILLGILVIACIFGSVIPQGQPVAAYESAYPKAFPWILALDLNNVFRCWWFVVLTAALCLNLLLCNLIHFKGLLKRMQEKSTQPKEGGFAFSGDPQALYRELGFRKVEKNQGSYYGIRNAIGIWGPWLTHLGILIIIVGFALGQMMSKTYTVYGVPGQEKPLGDTQYSLRIDDFEIILRADDTVEQYTAKLTLHDSLSQESWSGEASVNHPLDLKGMRFYQNSTGWAADAVVLKSGTILEHKTLCTGESMVLSDNPDLALVFYSFYPDYVKDASGQPATRSGRLNNPAYLYVLYYKNEMLGMNVLGQNEKITVGDYEIIFTNPQSYTLIQVKRDPFTGLAGIGGLVLMIALLIAFYLPREEVWVVPEGNGYTVYGKSRKTGPLLREKIAAAAEKMN